MSRASAVVARLPKAGLGNKLFVWAEALVFAREHGLPLTVTGWNTPQWRNWWRCGDLRWYGGYFTPWAEGRIAKSRVMRQPQALEDDVDVYEFTEIPHWRTCFDKLVPHREMIGNELRSHLTRARQREVGAVQKPALCVQVRMGDFRALKTGESFAAVGGVRTPLDYYKSMISSVRKVAGARVPVTLVSEGSDAELAELLQMDAVTRHKGRSSIADLFLMADSQVLVCAAGSSFSQWAVFLGEGVVLHHPEHFHFKVRGEKSATYEGAVWPEDVADWPEQLCEAIIRSSL
jgi:hypothetical protein